MEHWDSCAVQYIGAERSGFEKHHDSNKEASIRNFSVGFLAIATLAVAGFFVRRRRVVVPILTGRDETVEELYAAGL